MKSGTLNYNKGEIYYETVGFGVPIVFIHGFTLDHTMWRHQVEFFSKTNKVITYDVRGFGDSSLPNGNYNNVDDLRMLLKLLNIQKAHVVGLSMGGRIAINFVITHPELVLSLTLMDSALDGYKSEVDWNVYAKDVGVEKAKENWMKHELFAATHSRPEAIATLRLIVKKYSGWHWLYYDTQRPASSNARRRPREITQPTLIMVGENDLQYFHNISNVLASEIPRAQKIIVQGAGHMINIELPNLVNELLANFITSTGTPKNRSI